MSRQTRDEDRDAKPGDRKFTKDGVVVVFDGERWQVDPSVSGDGNGTVIREDDEASER